METPMDGNVSTSGLIVKSFRHFAKGAFEQVKRSYFIV
jgi:hypothetical protein